MSAIFTSEFFWGVVVGVLLSLVSAFAATWYQASQNRSERKEAIRKFLADAIDNIAEYITRLDDHRDRSKAIDLEFLLLIETEIAIYGRNREHLIWVDDDKIRKGVLEFFNKAATSIVRIKYHLNEFQKYFNAQNLENVDGTRRAELNGLSAVELSEANKKCDALISFVNGNKSLSARLRTIRGK